MLVKTLDELEAMKALYEILSPMEPHVRERVWSWVRDRIREDEQRSRKEANGLVDASAIVPRS